MATWRCGGCSDLVETTGDEPPDGWIVDDDQWPPLVACSFGCAAEAAHLARMAAGGDD